MAAAQNYILNQSYCPEETQDIGPSSYTTKFLKVDTSYENITVDETEETYIDFDCIPDHGIDDAPAKYVGRKITNDDYQVIPLGNDLKFYNDYLILTESNGEGASTGFSANKTYYFHGKVKRMADSNQVFYIKLKNLPTVTSTGDVELTQYIKTIVVGQGNARDWVDVEFIFTPLSDFPALVFELQREARDYNKEARCPIIAYLEISEVINYKTAAGATPLCKIGVQSHPGLLMCINGEEIRIGRTGIYELKDGVIRTTFFSVVHSAEELPSVTGKEPIFEQWKTAVNDMIDDIDYRENACPRGTEVEGKTIVYYEYDVNGYYYPSTDSIVLDKKIYYLPTIEGPSSNPHAEGFYEARVSSIDNKIYYFLTEDTEVAVGKEYYKLDDAKLLTGEAAHFEKQKIHSVVFCKTPKRRTTSSFILDYMY